MRKLKLFPPSNDLKCVCGRSTKSIRKVFIREYSSTAEVWSYNDILILKPKPKSCIGDFYLVEYVNGGLLCVANGEKTVFATEGELEKAILDR